MIFTFFDIVILSIILISTLLGFYRGMINIIVDIISMILILVLTVRCAPLVQSYLLIYLKNELISFIVTYIGIYLILSLSWSLILSKLTFLLVIFKVPIVDSVLGSGLGLLRGVVISIIIYGAVAIITTGNYLKAINSYELVYDINQETYPDWLKKSETKTFLHFGWHMIIKLIPDNYLKSLDLPYAKAKNQEDIKVDSLDEKEKSSMENSNSE
ncbi:MAG: CvpA family protein [Rickettsiaceae bacterium]|nr:CvpA family protein [Rickettsiaceae bacterium]